MGNNNFELDKKLELFLNINGTAFYDRLKLSTRHVFNLIVDLSRQIGIELLGLFDLKFALLMTLDER